MPHETITKRSGPNRNRGSECPYPAALRLIRLLRPADLAGTGRPPKLRFDRREKPVRPIGMLALHMPADGVQLVRGYRHDHGSVSPQTFRLALDSDRDPACGEKRGSCSPQSLLRWIDNGSSLRTTIMAARIGLSSMQRWRHIRWSPFSVGLAFLPERARPAVSGVDVAHVTPAQQLHQPVDRASGYA